MAKSGAHPIHALTVDDVWNVQKSGRYADGNGLYLHVRASGSRSWTLRLLIRGERKDIGLGGVSTTTLAEARETAAQMRKIARAGGDPVAERKSKQARAPTFWQAAFCVHEARKVTWRNAKHAAQWLSTLERYAFPVIGERPVDEIQSGDVLKVLGDIWLTKPETARRVRQRISTVLDWARNAGHRHGENPCVGVERVLPKQPERARKRHAAMAYDAVPAFLQRRLPALEIGLSSRLALEFLILTAARTSEVLEADWSEMDLDAAVWTVPASRMQAGKEHRAPLSDRACDVLREAARLSDGAGYVFPGAKRGRPLSSMALLMAHRRAGLDVTPHGYRSSFREWADERSSAPHAVVEAALAHTIEHKGAAADRRTDLFAKRRELMQAWARYVAQPKAEVLALRDGLKGIFGRPV